MIVNLRGKEVEVKYSFNSFKYMRDFSPSVLEQLEDKPFELIPFMEIMMLGALNHNKKVKFTVDDADDVLEDVSENGDISKLLEDLMELLQESGFFKSLQKD